MTDLPPLPPPLDEDNSAITKVARSAIEQDSDIPRGWKPTVAKPLPSIRCQHIKKDGNRCGAWGIPGTDGRCLRHGGSLPAVKKAAAMRVETARNLMMGSAVDMYDVLYSLTREGNEAGIRLKAATEILDRAGLKAGMEIAVTVEHIDSPLNDILEQLEVFTESSNTDDDIVDAETEEEFDDPDSDI
jgi:hypothetical protein